MPDSAVVLENPNILIMWEERCAPALSALRSSTGTGACRLQRAASPERGEDAPLPTERTLCAGSESAGSADRPQLIPVAVEVKPNAENLLFFEHPEKAVYVFAQKMARSPKVCMSATACLYPDPLLPQPFGSSECVSTTGRKGHDCGQ